MKKQDVLRLLSELPDAFDAQELLYHLYVLHKIEVGEAALQAGDLVPHADVAREIDEWLQSPGRAPR